MEHNFSVMYFQMRHFKQKEQSKFIIRVTETE
jgi:hypothetical protein